MDLSTVLGTLSELAYLLIVFGIFLVFAISRGRQATMNVIIALYLSLLISMVFPGYDQLFKNLESAQSIAAAKLLFFLFITAFTTALCYRIMPSEFKEKKFESMGKKILLAAAGTVLVMVFSFQVLPVTEFLTPGTPIQSLFEPGAYFFWWLLAPLVILYIV